jgi:hypothetical protein
MRKRADSLKEFLENKDSYIVTTKDYVMTHDEKIPELFIIKRSPFANEPQIPSDMREQVQMELGVDLLRGVAVYFGRYFKLKTGGLFAHGATAKEGESKKHCDFLLEITLTDTNRAMASDMFDLLKEWHKPVLYKKEVSFIKMIIRRSTIKKAVKIDIKDL